MHQHAARSQTLRRNGFTFKQFFVAHDRCAMKVGTDAILLGAWAPVPQTGCVLDIGCGSSIIAKRHYFDNSQLCFFATYQGI